jgi:hypothetical protein
MTMLARALAAAFFTLPLAAVATAQMPPPADATKILSDDYEGTSYSPYAAHEVASGEVPSKLLWGDTHLHTGMSFDAGAFGNRLGIADAYRFARGEEVVASSGMPVRLSRPLDYLVVADHSDNMGFFPDLFAGAPNIVNDPIGKEYYDRIQAGDGVAVAIDLIKMFSQGTTPESLTYAPDSAPYLSAWQKTIDTAEDFNDPGNFTAFIGFEWTSLIKGANMHRVVVYRDDASKASQMVAYTTAPPLGSPNPRDLWKWLDAYEKKTGGDVLAIAHNGNMSNGIMFPIDAQYEGTALDEAYVSERIKWEPLYETTQIKGDGETHPLLSTNDEFADYETWAFGNLDLSEAKTDDMLAGEYAREALKNGLVLEQKLGTNPYKFGQIGSTDSHTALATAQEDNFFGKHTGYEPKPGRMEHILIDSDKAEIRGWQMAASGLAAVWAPDNTREAIFDAMERKETYATTGSRMAVRFFGGWDFTDQDLESRPPALAGYKKGVPMGADLPARSGSRAPSFMVYALRDPIGGNLDRIQIVKGWLDADGKTHEKVYDVAWSGDRKPARDGKLAAVGNTVHAATASFINSIGAPELGTVWTDPDFDATQSSFYYARVIEIPTPRWTTYDAFRFGLEIPKGAPVSTQERAYTSPIWYSPTE